MPQPHIKCSTLQLNCGTYLMKNIVTISIQFYYKGEQHAPSMTVELDKLILAINDLSHFYPLLAKENNYDMYSYEFEMMQAEEIIFSDAEGLVADHIVDGALDLAAFKEAWHDSNLLQQLKAVALQHMDIDDLEKHPELKNALTKAYKLGQKK